MTKLQDTFNLLTTAVMVFDHHHCCTEVNEACEELFQKSRRSMLGRDYESIFKINKQLVLQCDEAINIGGRIISREVEIYLPQWQRSLLVDFITTAYEMEHETSTGLVLELIDLKDVSKLSKDAHVAARFKAATKIIRGLCHEIRNPLGGIRGAAQLLALETQSKTSQEYSTVITREVDRLNQLLNRLSSGAKVGQKQRIDIHEPLAHVGDLLKAEQGENLELHYEFDTSLPQVKVDVSQLMQALLNLMKNAMQWSMGHEQNKTASVWVKTRTAYPDLMRSLMPQSGIRVQIQDNGPGVDQGIIDQLFLPMVTRREGGTGLGLSISQEIMQAHGGFIELDPQVTAKGASFSLYLPYDDASN